ncbi:hypothetical protein NA571_23470, partial [Salmonella sp. NW438]|uniref:hypothetical protein n=1 Tax=Salmonella sp. NW438 TaxID=2947990 RepID=UPI003F4347D3
MSVTLTFDAARRKTYRESGYWGDASLGDYWRQTARAVLMNPLMILVKIIKLRWIHILSYDQ